MARLAQLLLVGFAWDTAAFVPASSTSAVRVTGRVTTMVPKQVSQETAAAATAEAPVTAAAVSDGSSSASTSTVPAPLDQVPVAPVAIKGCLFDMDGTLTDSDELHFSAYRDTILDLQPDFNDGKPIERDWYNTWMSGNSNAVITARLFPDMHLEEQQRMWDQKEALYRKISASMTPLPGLEKLLSWCDTAALKTIIVTNAPRIDAQHTMEVLGIHDRFGATVVIGSECVRAKPHPDPYLEGLRRLALPAGACIAFEDSINGCRAAAAAGLFTVGVMTGLDEATLCAAGAGACIRDFTDDRLWQLLWAR